MGGQECQGSCGDAARSVGVLPGDENNLLEFRQMAEHRTSNKDRSAPENKKLAVEDNLEMEEDMSRGGSDEDKVEANPPKICEKSWYECLDRTDYGDKKPFFVTRCKRCYDTCRWFKSK